MQIISVKVDASEALIGAKSALGYPDKAPPRRVWPSPWAPNSGAALVTVVHTHALSVPDLSLACNEILALDIA